MPQPDPPTIPGRRAAWTTDALHLGLLLALVLPLRLWLLCTTEVAARDSIGYIRYALDFEALPWAEVCKKHPQHPGYSLALLCVAYPLRAASGCTDAETMQLAAQLTSVLASLLLLYPMYHLGRLLFDRRAGFIGALLFQYFPINAHHLTDGLSEPLFVLLVAVALLQGVKAFSMRSAPRFAACGLASGLAYVTRPEGALVAAAAGIVLIGMQAIRSQRSSWRYLAGCASALLIGWVAVGSVYILATGHLTNKQTSVARVIDWLLQPVHLLRNNPEPRAGDGHALVATVPAMTFKLADDTPEKVRRSSTALAFELCNAFHYAGVLPAILGLGWSIGRLRRVPGAWMLAVYGLMHTVTLFALAMALAYVSDRHVMVLTLCGSYLVAAGLCELPRRITASLPRAVPHIPFRAGQTPAFWILVLLTGLIGFCLPKTLQRLHVNRAGNHAAGLWLARQLRPGDIVLDDHCWSHYYAGQVFLEGKEPAMPSGCTPACYVVVTRSRDPEIDESRMQAGHGELVYHWPDRGSVEAARVVVYRRPRDFATHPWRIVGGGS